MASGGRLTWDQVEAPDFRGVLDGYVAASGLIGNAMKTAQTGLDRLKDNQTNQADNAMMAELLKYQGNPDALMADLSSGSLQGRVDMSKLSAGMRDKLSTAPADLLKFAGDKARYDEGQKILAEGQFVRDNQHVFNPFFEAYTKGDQKTMDALREANPEKFEGISLDRLIALHRSGGSQYRDNLGNADQAFSNFTTERNDRVNEEVKRLEGFVTSNALPGDYVGFVNNNREKLKEMGFTDEGINGYYKRALDGFGSSVQAAGTGGGGGFSGGSYSGITASPDDAAALRAAATELGVDATDLATIISYETGGKFDPSIRGGKNNKHIGLIQFGEAEQGTYGASQNQSFREQLPAVVRYLKDRGVRQGDDITTLYKIINGGNRNANINASDGNGTIGGHVQKMLAEHRGNANGFLGLADPRGTQVAVSTGTAINLANDPQAVFAKEMLAAANDSRTAQEFAIELTGEKGQFKGQNTAAITKKIYDIAKNNDISEAQAARILMRHSRDTSKWDPDSWLDDNLGSLFKGTLTDGSTIEWNEEGIKQDVAFAKNRGALMEKARSVDAQQQSAANTAAANAAVLAAEQKLAAKRRLGIQMGIRPDTSLEEADLALAKQQAVGAGQTGAVRVLAGDTTRPHNRVATTLDAPVNLAKAENSLEPLGVRKAKAVLRLGGTVGQRQRENFQRTYGHTPEEVIQNPKLLDNLGDGSVTVALNQAAPRLSASEMEINANAALLQGAAAVQAFIKLYGQHPSNFIRK